MENRKPDSKPKLRRKLAKARRAPRRHLAFAALENDDLQMIGHQLERTPDLAHVRDLNGSTLLMIAIFRGKADFVDLLLTTSKPIDGFEAAALGKVERLAELLDSGEIQPDDSSHESFGLLHLTCFFGHPEAATLLLDRGAQIGAVSKHPMAAQPIHCAAASRHADLTLLLLDRGAKLEARQGGSWSVLQHAARHGERELAEALIARGADPAGKNDQGQTAAEIARAHGFEELAVVLDPGGEEG